MIFSDDIQYDIDPNEISSDDENLESDECKTKGRPEKSFKDAKFNSITQHSKIDPFIRTIQQKSTEIDQTYDQVIAYSGMRNAFQNGDFAKGKFYKDLYEKGPEYFLRKNEIPAEKMVYYGYVKIFVCMILLYINFE